MRSGRGAAGVRTASTLLAAVLLAVGLSFLGASTASAHSVLESSDPANGSTVSTGPGSVTLTFNEALQESYDVLNVVGPDGNFWQQGDASVVGARISVDLRSLGPAGVYRVNYRVTSADGHPVRGQVEFTLSTAGTGTPGPSATASSDDDGGTPAWPFIVGAVIVIVAVGGVFVLRRRARS